MRVLYGVREAWRPYTVQRIPYAVQELLGRDGERAGDRGISPLTGPLGGWLTGPLADLLGGPLGAG
ncbi:hypothetical protein AB0H03_16555 [Streptomyces sparsogenes]|uniref:hypothetical protein n=1 Tax=Streptomyces sparsogenes TaxID=67365 RepID=UPI0033D0D94C